jgi:hypothetical protein
MRLFHRTVVVAIVLTLGAAPGVASASGSGALLSGYSGPGGGEQSVLGQTKLPAKHGSGGIRAPSPPAVAPVVVAPPVTTPPVTTTTAKATPHPKHHQATTTTPATSPTTIATVTVTPRPSVTLPADQPKVVVYPAAASTAAGLPLSGSTLLAIVLGLLLLAGTALATRNLARPAG